LPLYFPEAERYLHSTRAEWFTQLLLLAPCPAAVLKYSLPDFFQAARSLEGHKNDKARWLADFYQTARTSVGLPVAEDSQAIAMFRLVLQQYLQLCRLRRQLEQHAVGLLAQQPDFRRLQTIPGIGPILALIILAEAGDLRRFSHHRKFLKYCGLDLCTEQSGQFRGTSRLSKRGNARLRYAFWMAGAVAVRAKQNSFTKKFCDYTRHDPSNSDLRRKAYTAVAAKMARVVYAILKAGTDYRRFPEVTMPGGRIPSLRAVEAITTS
jgi:transposase